jgi:hypothetical protein
MTAEQCRTRAEECRKLAQTASDPQRSEYLKLAQDWLALAETGTVTPHPVIPLSPSPGRE